MDATWPDAAVFSCPCGTLFSVTYWRWVDCVARPALEAQVRRDGPLEGHCPRCAESPRVSATWVKLDPSTQLATLVMGEHRRGNLLDELQAHLGMVAARPHAVSHWLLQPQHEFYAVADVASGEAHPKLPPHEAPVVPARSGELLIDLPPPPEAAALTNSAALAPEITQGVPERIPGVPQVIASDARTAGLVMPSVLGAYVGVLELHEGAVLAVATATLAERDKWAHANLSARPIYLRGYPYPLLGIRILGAFMGQKVVVDAFIDPAAPETNDIFRVLSRAFSLQLVIEFEQGEALSREVSGPGLEQNAALCLESARTDLASGEHPPDDFQRAKTELGALDIETRVAGKKGSLAAGAYQYIVGAAEAAAALAHLDSVLGKDSLAQMLEVEGMPMAEYDAIRRRVLAGSLEHGLVAPRRFWRRMIASGLVADFQGYADQLAQARAEHVGEEGDLPPEQARAAWESLRDLCGRKGLDEPSHLVVALGPRPHDAVPDPVAGAVPGSVPLDLELLEPAGMDVPPPLHDPSRRLKAATDLLQGRGAGGVEEVFAALDAFDVDELLAILPDLAELGARAVPNLLRKVSAPRREIRQAAVILLGICGDPDALEPLAQRLVLEPSSVWLDVARALGAFGPVVLRGLCQLLAAPGPQDETLLITRVARAFAEVALSDGNIGSGDPCPGHDAVRALADAGDPRVSAAAQQALATLPEVRASGAIVRGELPVTQDTQVQAFARRAYEAIMVPEVEVEAEG